MKLFQAFGANCYFGLGYYLDVPVIAVSSAAEYPWVNHYIGNNDNLAFAPNAFKMMFKFTNFWQRLHNFVVHYYETFKFHEYTHIEQTLLMRRYLDPNIPDIRKVEKNVALLLVNTHPIIHGVKPILSGVIPIAGLHIEENHDTLTEVN